RVVAQFQFTGARRDTIWLVLEREDVSVCFRDPGPEAELIVTADTLAMHRVWMGRLTMAEALKHGLIEIEGPRHLARAFPGWLMLSSFASIPSAR
ncbi:MAG: transcriptional regulator, partial [Dehalococcoidia bacterium]